MAHRHAGVPLAVTLYGLSLWAGVAALAFVVRRAFPGVLREALSEGPPDWWREALPFAGIGLLTVASGQVSVDVERGAGVRG